MWWWVLGLLLALAASCAAILLIKELIAYSRCKFYERQGFKMRYVPLSGHKSMFDVDPARDLHDHLGTWKRCFEPATDGPGLVTNDWGESKAFIWLTDMKLVKEFYFKELSCARTFRRYRERMGYDFIYSNDSKSLEIRNAFADFFFKENLNSVIRWMAATWRSQLADALKSKQIAGDEGFIDMGEASHRFTVALCNMLLFGADRPAPRLRDSGEELLVALLDHVKAIHSEDANYSLLNNFLFKWPSEYDLTPTFRALTRDAQRLHDAILELYHERAKATDDQLGCNLMDIMVNKNRATLGAAFSERQIVTAIVSHVHATMSSTSSAFGHAFFELGQRPAIADRIRTEVQSLGLPGPDTTVDTFDQARVLTAFIKEVLRVNPPGAFAFEKQAQCDFTLGKYQIRKGDLISIPYLIMQRAEGESSEKTDFDVDRFVDPQRAKNQTYMPFGFGHRSCTGKQLAELALMTVVAATLQMSEVTADLEKYPAVRMLGESYRVDQCILKCTLRSEPTTH